MPNLHEAMKVFARLSNYPGLSMKATINTIICFGYKVLGEDKSPKILNAWDYKGWSKDINDDFELVKDAYEILKDADVIVTQNGKSFDWKFFQTRLMKHGLPVLPKIQHIDTKILAKQNLFLFNNSLDTMSKFLTKSHKMDNGGWELWVDVANRNPKAMKKMEIYCKQDVESLHHVFERLRPFVKEMPNFNQFRRDGSEACPTCGGFNWHYSGYKRTTTTSYRRGHCRDCGSWFKTTDKKGPTPL